MANCASSGGPQPGTIIKLEFRQTEETLLAYEIETDTGMYCSASLDEDGFLRRLTGAPVIGDAQPPVKEDMLPAVVNEFQSWMPLCQEARTDKSTLKGPPSTNKYRCVACGKVSPTKQLKTCSRCRTVAYCNASCQERDYREHREACKAVAKGRDDFLAEYGSKMSKRERKQALRHGSRSQLQYETLHAFLMESGLFWGGAHFLRGLVERAFWASESSDGSAAMRQLVDEHVDGMGSIMSEIIITSDNLARLVSGVLHFFEKAPDIASYCAAGVDLFFQVSMFRPLVLYDAPAINEDEMPEEFKKAQRKARREEKRKKKMGRSNKHKK